MINPYFFTGFVQADGCFHVNIQKSKKSKHNIRILPTFCLTVLNSPNKQISPVLRMSRELLGTGHYITDKRNNCSSLRINTLKQLSLFLLPHFESFPLLSAKRKDYLVFKEIVESMSSLLHRDSSTFSSLLEKSVLINNKGKYRKEYKNSIVCISTRNKADQDKIETGAAEMHPQFVSGLFQGDGSFGISFRTRKNRGNKTIPKLQPFFTLGQDSVSLDLLKGLQTFFKCGKIYPVSPNYSRWMVSEKNLLIEKVLPHFETFPLIGVKNDHLLIFKRCLALLVRKTHRQGNVQTIVEDCYDYNMGGKRRRLSKEEYLKTITS